MQFKKKKIRLRFNIDNTYPNMFTIFAFMSVKYVHAWGKILDIKMYYKQKQKQNLGGMLYLFYNIIFKNQICNFGSS